MAEIEAKFLLESESQAERAVDLLRSEGLEVRRLPAVEVLDRYLDTPDGRILRAGWAYRWREAGGKRWVGLKSVESRGGMLHEREEVERRVAVFPRNGLLPGEVARTLGALRRIKARELFQVRNHRRLFQVRSSEGAEMEMAIDRATVTATLKPRKRAPGLLEFEELELELKEGPEEALRRLAETLRDRLGLMPSQLSKYERGLQTIGAGLPPGLQAGVPGLDRSLEKRRKRPLTAADPVVEYAWRYLLETFESMLRQEPKASEGLDPEGVHRMRVATRRLRAALRTFKPVVAEADAKGFDRELKWVARALGEVRDPDVLQEKFERNLSELPAENRDCFDDYRKHLADRWKAARKELLACFASERYRRLKGDFAAFVQKLASEAAGAEEGALSIGELAAGALGKLWKKVLRNGRAITADSPDETLHELRIHCKRLRYGIEIFQPIYGKPLKRLIRAMKELQDVLGEFQDACVANLQLREYAQQVPLRDENRGELLGLGQLIHNQWLQAASQRAAFHTVWKSFDLKGRRKDVLALLR